MLRQTWLPHLVQETRFLYVNGNDRKNEQVCNLYIQKNKEDTEIDDGLKQCGNPFTPEQVQKILSLLQDTSNHNVNQIQSHNSESIHHHTNNSWILDTRVIDHVTCVKSHFISLNKIKPIYIS